MSRGRVGRTATRDIVPRRTVLAALASGGGLVALAGCADLPTDGQVTSSDVVSAHGSQLVQTAARPRDGAGPAIRMRVRRVSPSSMAR